MESQSLKRVLEMLAATINFCCGTVLCLIGPVVTFYITFFTTHWHVACVYLIWIWIFDKNTPEQGGRVSNFIRRLKVFEYARDYYPVTLRAFDGFKLVPDRNYIFGCFPHGIMANGSVIALMTNACGIDHIIPNHQVHVLTLDSNFKVPIYREYLLSIGGCSVTAKSINWLLNFPKGGKIAAIFVGGAAEALLAKPGEYKIVLRNRKGFVKLALKNGSPLVPVFSFGEVDVFNHIQFTEGSLFRRIQEWCKRNTGISPITYSGRGYFQNCAGFIPFRKPINVVIGNPIDVKKTEDPSQYEVDLLHHTFMTELNRLFEEYKHHYIEHADKTFLVMV